jgi:hypothetical protein
MNYGTVEFAASIATVDSGDTGPEPDIIPATGYVKFVPSRVVTYNDDTGSLIVLAPIQVGIDAEGVMRDPDGNDSVTLIASDSPELSHQGWTWEAYISLNDVDPIGPYPFVLNGGENVPLGLHAPVEISNGVAILRGPPGPEGPEGPPGPGGSVDSVNGEQGDVELTAADIGIGPASASAQGLMRLAGMIGGTPDNPQVPSAIRFVLNFSNTDTPARPAHAGMVVWVTFVANQPAGNGSTAGGTYAMAEGDLLAVFTP